MKDFYTTDQVSKFCNVSRGSVIRWIHEGKLRAATTVGGHHRIAREEIIRLLEIMHFSIPAELTEGVRPVALLVEDDEATRKMLRDILESRFPDFQVEEASDGFEAGLKIQKFRPRLVLLDICLPGQDGLDVCRLIRNFPELQNMVIIAVSGMQDPEVRKSVLELGANDFIPKPFDYEVLCQKIETYLKLKPSEQEKRGPHGPISNVA